ncbi:8007_t:CDS:2, partial [Ambispora gerdemannii]
NTVPIIFREQGFIQEISAGNDASPSIQDYNSISPDHVTEISLTQNSNQVDEKKAKGQIYNFIIAQLDTKCNTLQKQTKRARKIYSLFEKIDHFTKKSDIEFTDEQNNSSDNLPEAKISISIDQDSELPEASVNASTRTKSLITALSDDEPENFSDNDEFTNNNEEDESFCGFSDDNDE